MDSSNSKRKAELARISTSLFIMIEELGALIEDIIFTPYGELRINRIPRTTYYNRLRKFEDVGLIKKVGKKYGNGYVLTEKAKKLRKNPTIKITRSDGFSTIIMFDIPEAKHRARDNFRRFLIRNGYTQVQKSAFISPFKISDELLDFVQELGIRPNVSFISGKIYYPSKV